MVKMKTFLAVDCVMPLNVEVTQERERERISLFTEKFLVILL